MADRMTTTPVTNDVSVPAEVLQQCAWKAERSADTIKRNLGHQQEKIKDAEVMCAEIGHALRDALAARPAITAGTDAGVVKVKLLEWQEESGEYTAITVVGWYHIGRPASKWNVLTPPAEIHSFETLAEAKALAQADYERRILSALTPETAEAVPVAAQPGEAVREALEAVQATLQRILDATVASTNSWDAKQGLDWAKVVVQSAMDDLGKTRAALASVPAPAGDDVREDERDRLMELAFDQSISSHPYKHKAWAEAAKCWLADNGAMYPVERRRVRAALTHPKEPRT